MEQNFPIGKKNTTSSTSIHYLTREIGVLLRIYVNVKNSKTTLVLKRNHSIITNELKLFRWSTSYDHVIVPYV